MNAITRRESELKYQKDIWNVKLGYTTLDFYKPKKESIASWVSELERQNGKVRFHPHWGSACSKFGGTTDWNAAPIELRKVA